MNIRNLLLILLSVFIFGCNNYNQELKTDIVRFGLNGKVKSYLEIVSWISNFQNDSLKSNLEEQHRELLLFNQIGNIVEKNSFYKSGKLYKKWISMYDKNDFEIGKIEIEYPNDTLKRWLYKYDKLGNNIESITYDHKDSILSHTKSTYNDFNKKTESLILKSKNSLVKVNYQYNNNGNKIKTTRFYKDKSKTEWFTKHDSYGNEIEWIVYDLQGNLDRRDVSVYDKYNNLIDIKTFDNDNTLDSRSVMNYDSKGNEIEYLEYFRDSTFQKEEYFYDSRNDIIKTLYYDTEGILYQESTTEYKYDEYNNLIKEINWEDGKLIEVRIYEIKYWE